MYFGRHGRTIFIVELPAEMFVRRVDGTDDTFAFQYDFLVEGKAVQTDAPATVTTELENGDIIIEGYAAVFEGVDREGENFEPGAFKRGVKSFVDGQAALCYHHDKKLAIGSVLDLREEEGKGLWMRARVDNQEPTSPLRWIYDGIRKGSMKGLSVGGFFKRKLTELGYKISDVDFTEVSVTPVPIHPGTKFAVVAGKALGVEEEEVKPAVEPGDDVLRNLSESIDGLNSVFAQIEQAKALPSKHDPKDARFLKELLNFVAQARTIASAGRDDVNDEGIVQLADEVETQAAQWEATAHKLAAKIGPLPASPVL